MGYTVIRLKRFTRNGGRKVCRFPFLRCYTQKSYTTIILHKAGNHLSVDRCFSWCFSKRKEKTKAMVGIDNIMASIAAREARKKEEKKAMVGMITTLHDCIKELQRKSNALFSGERKEGMEERAR